MSSSVLYQRLRELTEASLIEKADDENYVLTSQGVSLGKALQPHDDWAVSWTRYRSRRRP